CNHKTTNHKTTHHQTNTRNDDHRKARIQLYTSPNGDPGKPPRAGVDKPGSSANFIPSHSHGGCHGNEGNLAVRQSRRECCPGGDGRWCGGGCHSRPPTAASGSGIRERREPGGQGGVLPVHEVHERHKPAYAV